MRLPRISLGLPLLGALAVAACEQTPVEVPLAPSFDAQPAECNAGPCEAPEVVTTDQFSADGITAILQPDAAYVGTTALIDISGLTLFASYGSISDGLQTVTFSTPVQKRGPVPTGWFTWNSPPATETPNPHVLWTLGAQSLTMNLSFPTPTFGFELEPNPFSAFTFTVDFYSAGGTVLEGSITRTPIGNAGALLFAATSTGGPIDQVVVNGPVDFAIARVRYVPNRPPDCSGAYPSLAMLWPVNHKFVAIDVLGVTDPDGDPFTISIDAIFQDEPTDTYGDGNFAPDGQGVGTATAEVRAERVGTPAVPGNGRVYHIYFTATDPFGATCSAEVLVAVPHDQKGNPAVDDGPLHDSTI